MKKIGKLLSKYKLTILIAVIILIVGTIGLILVLNFTNDKVKIKEFKNDNCKFEYDTTWNIKSDKDGKVILSHKSKSKLEIEIVKLEDEYKYSNVEDIFDEILYDISKQNDSFKLLSTKEDSVTKNKYDGYKLLYENDDSQAMLVIGKSGDKLLLFTYEAKNDYFDILLDSVQNIIYNFEIVEESFALNYKLNINTSKIEWSENKELVSTIKENIDYEVANDNYLVNLSVPSNFKITTIDSSWLYTDYEDLEKGNINLSASVNNWNIYEEIDEDMGVKTIFYQYKSMREGTYGYDFSETLEEMEKEKGYIYKVSYKTKTEFGGTTNEYIHDIVHLIYKIDASHILTITIEADDHKIPKELIDKIKINSYTNYSSYVTRNIENGNLIGELKRFTDYNKDKIEVITLRVPERYEEYDIEQNMYTDRYYRYNYDEEKDLYEYEVEYSNQLSLESNIDIINRDYESRKSYGEYKLLTYVKDITINNKTFKLYEGGYTDIAGALFSDMGRTKYYANTKVLFYDLGNDECLTIHIKGNGSEISESLLEELTNFDIEIENY